MESKNSDWSSMNSFWYVSDLKRQRVNEKGERFNILAAENKEAPVHIAILFLKCNFYFSVILSIAYDLNLRQDNNAAAVPQVCGSSNP
jgi:hypothetical protein